jgi:ribonuclease BN (tRNA processing enzyme)|tara:strand:+ start:2167 stop:3501 length:1335 start_codon:yes stop_codon:yes gene_type:complete
MQVTHYCNSFNSFKAGNSTLVCDPWVGVAAQTAWVSFPIHENGGKFLNNLRPDFIYISHLHCDHLDPKTLLGLKNKNTKIIIKKFKIPILKKQIQQLGFDNICEYEPWKKYRLNKDISFAIVPQMSSNNSGLPEQINYDLDTSIVLQSNKTKEVFYNGVDNPLTDKNYITVKKFIEKKFNKNIAIAVVQDGAAGEYPQCFLNIDRKKAKEKVILDTLKSVKKKIEILRPEKYISTSPSAIIAGKFSKLNNLAAKPTFNDVKNYLETSYCDIINISGGGTATKIEGKWKIKKMLNFPDEKKIIKKYLNKKYFYENDFKNIKNKNLDNLFLKACENYKEKVKRYPIKTSWVAEFHIYKNLLLNRSKKIDKKSSKFIKKYSLDYNKSKTKKNFTKLICHLDEKLFYGLLTKKYTNWNQPTVGTLVLYERKPNKFDPNLLFSLNFLQA